MEICPDFGGEETNPIKANFKRSGGFWSKCTRLPRPFGPRNDNAGVAIRDGNGKGADGSEWARRGTILKKQTQLAGLGREIRNTDTKGDILNPVRLVVCCPFDGFSRCQSYFPKVS